MKLLFLEKSKEYKKYGKVSSIVMSTSVISLFLLLILLLIFEWSFLEYLALVFKVTFILGIIIDAIPDFLEKNVKHIIWDLIFIIFMITIFFLL